jgi:hypothetical protein
MSETSLLVRKRVLWLSSVGEMGTGAFLLLAPGTLVELLLGLRLSPVGMPLARVAGLALLALGLACWHTAPGPASEPAFRGMLLYNALIALYLLWLGAHHHIGGVLLWPVMTFHTVVTLLLLWTWRESVRASISHSSPSRGNP